jgi:hypothetical protein
MKMLFFSSERAEAEIVCQELCAAGVPCEIRENQMEGLLSAGPPHAEVWIQNDADSHRAVLLCVELGVGFAKRPATIPLAEEEEPQKA